MTNSIQTAASVSSNPFADMGSNCPVCNAALSYFDAKAGTCASCVANSIKSIQEDFEKGECTLDGYYFDAPEASDGLPPIEYNGPDYEVYPEMEAQAEEPPHQEQTVEEWLEELQADAVADLLSKAEQADPALVSKAKHEGLRREACQLHCLVSEWSKQFHRDKDPEAREEYDRAKYRLAELEVRLNLGS